VGEVLQTLGVEVIPAQADKHLVAACELGVTGADAALPETGTLLLRSSPERPRVVSLLPRVHLAIFTPTVLRADLHQVFAEAKDAGYSVLVTGPSRTADIELTLTLGVHGPKSLYAWVLTGY
jgi:L-lactate dehydrogenase complex protein LldG